MNLKVLSFLIVFFFGFSTGFGQTAEPILMLNTETHTAKTGGIDSDAAGKYVLTCSNDKTAKLWNAASGDLIRTLRVPIGEGNEGLLYACAISPDGSKIAVGGWSKYHNNDIFIFESASGEIIHRISGFWDVINDLEFSPSGRYLVASLNSSNGIQIFKTSTLGLYREDKDYGDAVYNMDFDFSGRLATVSYDGYIRLYDSYFNLVKKIKPSGGKRPFSIAFSPNGKLLAVGFDDSFDIQVLDGNNLNYLYSPSLSGINTHTNRLDKVSFSKDGSKLIAGGFYSLYISNKWQRQIRVWSNVGKGTYSDYNASLNGIMDIKPLSHESVIYSTGKGGWGVLNLFSGEREVYNASQLNNYGTKDKDHFKISHDGYNIGITPHSASALTFHLDEKLIREQTSNLHRYQDSFGNIEISDWNNSNFPKLNGKVLSFLESYERSHSTDITSDQSKIIFGADWNLYCLDSKGKELWEVSTQAAVWCVNISGNNKIVVAALNDGTIRWYRMTDGESLLTLYLHPDNKRWVLWTPQGFYDAAPGAEDLIGWHVNQGPDNAALFYPASKFRYKYYRPDVVDRVLETLDVDEALRKANEVAKRFSSGPTTRNIVNELPPTVKILNPMTGTTVDNREVELEYSINSPNGEEITGLKAMVNGRPVAEKRGFSAKGTRGKIIVDIPNENCTVSLIARNRFGSSEAAAIRLKWKGQTVAPSNILKPNLYVLAIGVSEYDNEELRLDFAAKDARDFHTAIKKQHGRLYKNVHTKVLTDSDASRIKILDGLEWVVKETTQHDVAMIFFAGHGRETSRGTFYYVPVESDLTDSDLRRHGIMREDIKETVATIAGKVIVFMDACHSGRLMETSKRRGAPDMTRIINELIDAENGAVVFSSSIGSQFSLEDIKWNNGAFTKALVEGLNGEADLFGNGRITCKSLDSYVTQRVKELTDGKQSTSTNFPPNVQDFPIGINPNK